MVLVIYMKFKKIFYRLARRRPLLLVLVFFGSWSFSALLFYHYEKGSGIDLGTSIYWALITMATVGYGDVIPTTGMGRVVAGIAAIFGIAVYTLFISTLANYFIEATVKAALGLGVVRGKRIIVIGEGPVCEEAVRELVANKLKGDTGWILERQPKGGSPVDYIVSSLDEDSLKRAGLKEAEHVIICYEDDSKAIHATALVKELNPKAKLTVLAKDKATMRILEQMGVENVVPVAVLGRLLASSTFEPSIATFLSDATTARKGVDLSEYYAENKTVSQVEKETGYRVVALVDKKGAIHIPSPDTVVKKGEKLIVLRKPNKSK